MRDPSVPARFPGTLPRPGRLQTAGASPSKRRPPCLAFAFSASLALHLLILSLGPSPKAVKRAPSVTPIPVALIGAELATPAAKLTKMPSNATLEKESRASAGLGTNPQFSAARTQALPAGPSSSGQALSPPAPAAVAPAREDSSAPAEENARQPVALGSESAEKALERGDSGSLARTAPRDGRSEGQAADRPGEGIGLPFLGPRSVYAPKPNYPERARRENWQGTVLLGVLIGADGEPKRIEIVQSSGFEILDRAAARALERWRFEPARAGQEPMKSHVRVPVIFRLTEAGFDR